MKKKCLCGLFLLVLAVLSVPASAEIYYPIWGILKAQAGSGSQSNDDLIMNSVDLGSSELSCNRGTSGGDYIYSVTFTKDLDNDGSDDTLTFDLRVEAFEGSTYIYDPNAGQSSMTALGASSDVTDIANGWGVGGDYDIDAGQSLRFSVENIICSAGSVTFEGMTSVSLVETNGGHSHKYIPGEGTGLDSGIFSTPTATCAVDDTFADEFVITGAGSYYAGSREWAVSGISFMFRGPLVDWDLTDYSYYKIGTQMLEEYPAQTDFTNYPDFSWDTVPRWLIVRKGAPAYTNDEVAAMAGNYEVIVWEKANKAGFSYIEDGIIDASSRVKAIDPSIKSLFYRNTVIHYGGYESDSSYNEWDWSQKTTDEYGEEILDLHKDIYPKYNADVADFRNWWVNVAALPTILHEPIGGIDPIDGVFYDKCGFNSYIYDGNGDPADNYIEMLDTMDQELPPGKLVMGNTLRNERLNGSRDLMRILEGSYMERWAMPYSGSGQSAADAVCVSIQLMREASSKGKIILFKTGANDAAKTQEEMEADMPYHLALYLIVAEPYSYFAFQDTVNALEARYQWETSWMPEFSRPLGPPLGDPIKDGYIYTRSFEHVDVWVDVSTEQAVLTWKPIAQELIAHWSFDDGAGTTVTDSSGQGHHATATDGACVDGVNGGAMDFDGSSSTVTLPPEAFDSMTTQASVAVWVYGGTTQPAEGTVFRAKDASGNRVLNIDIPWSTSIVYWDAGNSGTSSYDQISKVADEAQFKGRWNHWVFTKNADTGDMKMYHNGSLWHSDTGKTRTMGDITAAMIGSAGDADYYDGRIDDVRLYNYELSAGEVAELFNEKPCDYYLTGDRDFDCKVELEDFAFLAAQWLANCDVACDADLDILILMAETWLVNCTTEPESAFCIPMQ